MAAEKPSDIDLDEDLFDFEPIGAIADRLEDEEADLDEIFASFQADGEAGADTETPIGSNDFQELDEGEEDIYGSISDMELPAPVAPEPGPVATPATNPVQAPAQDPASTPASTPTPAPTPALASRPTTAAQPALEPSAAQAPAAPKGVRGLLSSVTSGGPMTRSALWILLAAMSLNGLVAIVLVSSTGQLRDQMSGISDEVDATIRDIRSEYWGQKAILMDETTPIAAPNPENHPAFERALQEIEEGQYSAARQRLYALLAVIDRLDSSIRDKVEARATYLIGHAWHLEALQRLQEEELGDSEQ